MSLRINHNVAAMNSWRNLQATDRAMDKTLEKLSSGKKLNRAGDGPASMVIAEQMRAQSVSMEQAVSNSEIAISMVQTAEASLNETSNILIRMRQLSLHAANEGANDDKMLAADQAEIENSLKTLDMIAKQAQFGTRNLLDGSNGLTGVGVGEGMRFVKAEVETQSSPADGYEVDVTQVATRARMEGARALSEEEMYAGNIKITLNEGGRSMTYFTKVGETMDTMVKHLQIMSKQNHLDLNIGISNDNKLFVEHNQYGSEPSFGAIMGVAGVLTQEANVLEEGDQGMDVQGSISGELAHGEGQYLTGAVGTNAEGLTVQYTGGVMSRGKLDENGQPILDANGQEVTESIAEGAVFVSNNALSFQVGPGQGHTVEVGLPNVNMFSMSRGVENESGFGSLGEVDVTTFQGAQDTIKLLDQAIYEVTSARGELGAFQKNTLESNLSSLRYSVENLISAESILRDTDMAREMSEFTKQQILLASGTAMLGQANQTPKAILSLLNGK